MAEKNDQAKVLRVGVIQGVHVIEERILTKKGPVTFGTADGNTFSLAASDLPKTVTVFDVKNDGYELVFDDSMHGRIEGPDGKKEFAALKASGAKQGSVYRVPLSTESKGRVKLSPEITVMFHFVVPPAAAVAMELPADVRGGLVRSIEPIFTSVLTASFLVHFGFGLFIRFTEPPAPPTLADLKELVERIEPPKVEVKLPPPTKVTDTGPSKGPATDPDVPKGTGSGSGSGDGGGSKGGGSGKGKGSGNGGIGDRNAIREGIAGKGILQMIGGRGGGFGGGAVGSVFGSGAGISDDIGGALAGTAGVGIAGAGGGGDGVTRRGSGGGGGGGDGSGGGAGGAALGIGDLTAGGGGGGGKVDTGVKQATKVQSRVNSEDVEAVDGKVDKKGVNATIRRRQEAFQACYETGLKSNSKLAGKIVIEFTIGTDGRVTEARTVKDGIGSAEVASCIVNVVKRLRFPVPADGEVTISTPFVFQPGGA